MSKSEEIKRNSHNIWLAGLGAYSMIETEGSAQYETLLAKGKLLESKSNAEADKLDKPNKDSRLNDFKIKANQTMDRIEKAFDLRVSSALSRLGISTKTDLDNLNDRIANLTSALEDATKHIEQKPIEK